jgi:hypothetical protein
MTDPFAPQPDWRDRTTLRITIRPIWLAVVLSVLGHLIALWFGLPHLKLNLEDPKLPGGEKGKFDVVLAPPPRPHTPPPPPPTAAEPPPAVKPVPRPRAAPPPAARRPPPTPPVVAMKTPAPTTTPAPPPTPAPPVNRPPDMGDFSSFVEANRRARAQSQPQPQVAAAPAPPSAPAESDTARANRNLAASIASQQPKDFGDPSKSGGIFSVQRMGLNDAEFVFYGWSFEARRNLSQLIEVKRGNNPNMQLAVVRKMIEIIRQYEKADFQWESRRLGRWVTLSAAQRDTAGLESFLLQEFFQAQ